MGPLASGISKLYGRRGWAVLGACAAILFLLFPLANLALPKGSLFYISDYTVALTGKIMCYAIVAVAMDLIWGYTGILSLGHGLFFALGGYAMGMYLMRMIGREGQYQSDLPDFMVFLDWKTYPWYWSFTDHFWYAALLVVLVPGLLAFAFGFFAFRSRIKGVYFSIITQALTFAFMLLFFRNDTGFGGNNGFTDFKRILGIPIATPQMRMALFAITGATLIATLLLGRFIVTSKFGRVLAAIREIGPVITAIVLAGVAGTAITADLGARKIREELDALQVLGVDPVKNLVVPRFLALMLATGLFNIYAVLFGLFGGILAALVNEQPLGPFWNTLFANASVTDLWGSVLKTTIFGAIIAIVCCYKGMTASGGAEGVGRAVNQAVVVTFLAIFAFDYVFTQTLLATHPEILVIK